MSFPVDRIALSLLLLACVILAGLNWLQDHPEDNPWAPLTLDEQPGWATGRKLAALRADLVACRAFLDRSGLPNRPLPPEGAGACRREDRGPLLLPDATLKPQRAEATCAVDAGMAFWLRHVVQPQAEAMFSSPVIRIEHLGTVNCRRIGNGAKGAWSEHATGNAIDVSAFVLANGRRVEVKRDWKGGVDDAAFLHAVRDGACGSFSTVLSPDYNAAHADHLHLDQARRTGGWKACH
ncbi:extensin family protein [Novosphingobium sp. BL-8H]|uniref:extensin-like domain-containing protein n=1 Tax=Novosphingobium sp. BL-8H TaxID=3127640 RepID=UPI003756868E